jgi:hypothetical protein
LGAAGSAEAGSVEEGDSAEEDSVEAEAEGSEGTRLRPPLRGPAQGARGGALVTKFSRTAPPGTARERTRPRRGEG